MPSSDAASSDGGLAAGLLVRPAAPKDRPALAEVMIASRSAAWPAMPPFAAHADYVRADVEAMDLDDGREVWVAESSGQVVGLAELKGDWLDDLYVHPDHSRAGVGSALLDCIKALRPGGFALWCFATNEPARAFYRRHGCVELETTDGAANIEQAPDVRIGWPGSDPVAWLRTQIDEVDAHLARLIAQRVALTAAVQPFKPVPGRAGRDPQREHQIAARMAQVGPGVDIEAYARVLDLLVDLGLDRHEHRLTEETP